jgi:hypothetical protein
VSADRLVVHTADGVIEVQLSGEPDHDALLLRLARRGGPVTTAQGVLIPPPIEDPDGVARRAMSEGA